MKRKITSWSKAFFIMLIIELLAFAVLNFCEIKYGVQIGWNFSENNDEAGFISAGAFSGLDSMEISVFGNEDRIILTARYDNLGKGASGAAIECLNIVLGQDETTGLVVK